MLYIPSQFQNYMQQNQVTRNKKKEQVQVTHRTVLINRILIQILYSLLKVSVLRDKDLEQFLNKYVLVFFWFEIQNRPTCSAASLLTL